MNLGSCWQSDVWADGSWVTDVWCPESPCVAESIGDCWQVVWCSGTWQNNSWCPSTPPSPPVIVAIEERRWPGPSYILWSDDLYYYQKQRRKREDEEFIIL